LDNLNSVGIIGLGSCVPDKVLTNSDLEKMVETSDEWITKRTGIKERRILEENTPAYELGVKAAQEAIEQAGINVEDIGMVIVATESPDYLSPTSACIIQDRIKAYNAAAFDMNAACTGFIYAMDIAKQYISTGVHKYILIVGCEGLSKIVDWQDRASCVLLGDGAGAVILGKVEKEYGIIDTILGAEGNLGHHLTIPCCFASEEDKAIRNNGKTMSFWMDGSEVYKFATRVMYKAVEDILQKTGYTLDDVKYIVPHQANIRIIEGAVKRLKIDKSKVIVNIQNYGNTSSATVPIALNEEVVAKNKINRGDIIIFVAFGGGLTWGVTLVKWY